MLATAHSKETARHRGEVVDVAHSAFAPSAALRRELAQGTLDDEAFAERYALDLRIQWATNPLPFRQVIESAKKGDVTLVDSWAISTHAPRRVLAGVLAQIARGRMERPRSGSSFTSNSSATPY